MVVRLSALHAGRHLTPQKHYFSASGTQYVEFRPVNYYNITTETNYDQINLINETDHISGFHY
jgi:hypothetical protein